jgi:hypothetical protein
MIYLRHSGKEKNAYEIIPSEKLPAWHFFNNLFPEPRLIYYILFSWKIIGQLADFHL